MSEPAATLLAVTDTARSGRVGDLLRARRLGAGLSRRQAADVLGASEAVIARWEDGTANPSPAQHDAIRAWAEGGRPAARDAFASAHVRHAPSSRMEEPVRLGPVRHGSILDRIGGLPFLRNTTGATVEDVLAEHRDPAPVAPTPPAGGMSAGKNTYTYDAHTYHTKVPPQGIAELLRHYLPEGGLVLDLFAGSGMTGVAASVLGMDCVLNELSPAAGFIASRFTSSIAPERFEAALEAVREATREIREELYSTACRECGRRTELLYTVWSYRVQCSCCGHDFQLWDECRQYGRTVRDHRILTSFPCPACGETLAKSKLSRSVAEPVEIGYKCCGSRQKEVNHPPDDADLARIAALSADPPEGELRTPTDELPDGVNLNQPKRHGLNSVDRFYTARNRAAMSQLWTAISRIDDDQLAAQVAFAFTGLYRRVTRFSEFRFWGGSGNTARLNVPYISDEANVFVAFDRKARTIKDHLETTAKQYRGDVVVRVGSATDLSFLPDESIDLVFTDPPFGGNINYSEMNLLWEAWLGARTDTADEAIVNRVQGKGVDEYGRLMTTALRESHRVLRPGSWMLLVFMNSSARVWSALNGAIEDAGFVVAAADVFDKQHGTFKHHVSPNTPGADLVIHCRKPHPSTAPVTGVAAPVSVERFLASVDASAYTQSFLHVDRDPEPDLRRLYSEWLSRSLGSAAPVLDFAAFRARVLEEWGLPAG